MHLAGIHLVHVHHVLTAWANYVDSTKRSTDTWELGPMVNGDW